MTNSMYYALSYAKRGKYVDHRLAIHTTIQLMVARSSVVMLFPKFSRCFVAIVALNLLEKFWKYSTVSSVSKNRFGFQKMKTGFSVFAHISPKR